MKKKNTLLLLLPVPAVVGVSLLVQLAFPQEGWQFWLVRGFSLSGYLLVFLAVLSAASLPAMAKTFGRPFIGVHHVATVAGFVAMVAHPFAYSFAIGSLSPFVPRYGSLLEVFQWAGRPALALFASSSSPYTPTCSARRSRIPSCGPSPSPWPRRRRSSSCGSA
jgi:hypothetical protein